MNDVRDASLSRTLAELIARAEALGPDAPWNAESPAIRAAELAHAWLSSGPAAASDPATHALRKLAANALRLGGPPHDAEALATFERLLHENKEDSGAWHDLSLCHKWRGRFHEALAAAEQARRLAGDLKPILWNIAIAATALGDGPRAVEAWTRLGFDAHVTPNGRPMVDGVPPVQARLPTRGSGIAAATVVPDRAVTFELVWVTPLSPCHGVVATPTFRTAVVDAGDVILWDGAPVGVAVVEGRPVPRFPFLGVLGRGDERRVRFAARGAEAGALAGFADDIAKVATLFEQTEQIEGGCAHAASRAPAPLAPDALRYGKLVIAGDAPWTDVVTQIEAAAAHRRLRFAAPALYELSGDSVRAGKAHQLWGALERGLGPSA